jgi:DNA-binding MarR family transcriptional regulator
MSARKEDAARAWDLLLRFVVTQRAQLPAIAAEFSLSPVQCHVLRLIPRDEPIPMGRLAETLSCDASNVTGLVDRLESRKLIERRPAANDRRVKVIALTPAGLRLQTQLQSRLGAPPGPFSRLSPAQRRSLIKILEALLK